MRLADLNSDGSDDEAIIMATQHARLNDGTVQVRVRDNYKKRIKVHLKDQLKHC